jgi:hypothetical protein
MKLSTIIKRFIFILSIATLFQSCKDSNRDKIESDTINSEKLIEIYNNIREKTIGKKISSWKKIKEDYKRKGNILIYYYNGYDCISCVEKGFLLTKEIDNKYGVYTVNVVASNSNISREQLKYNYFEYIYNDSSELIRQELKYIPTPVMLILDENLIVKDVCFFHFAFKDDQDGFIESI